MTLDLTSVLVMFAALALGGTLKGATGAGAPVIAVPVLASFLDVRLAVMLMAAPNLITNIWQCRAFWTHVDDRRFAIQFAVAGAAGAVAGTFLLAIMPIRVLTVMLAGAVIAYVGLRMVQPEFRLDARQAKRIVAPIGALGGILQGAGGISAPISVSFLNSLRMERKAFIGTISIYFIAMAATQLPALFATGLMTPTLLALSTLCLVPLFLFIPVGAWAASRLSPEGFDRLTLALLSLLAVRLIYVAFS